MAKQRTETQAQKNGFEATNILERITDGFYALDPDWKVTYWNKEAEAILGKSRQEVLGKNLWKIFPDIVALNFYSYYHEALEKQVPLQFEGCYPPQNIWVDVNVYPSFNGISVFFKNITERKKIDEELQKLSWVAKETNDAVMITDTEQRIIWVNNAFVRITGYSAEEVMGKIPSQFLQGKETDRETAKYIREQLKKGEGFTAEIISYRKDGKKFWTDVSCHPIFDDKGRLKNFFSIERDITERKEMQKQITNAVINAQELVRSQVGRELHDNVNQVLTTVKIYLELCRAGNVNTSETLEKSITYLNESINEIKNLSQRLSSPTLGKIKLKDSLEEMINGIDESHFKISLDISIGNLFLENESHLGIYRILQEHLNNIIRHASAKTVQISVSQFNNRLSIVIVDDGVGFDTSSIKKGLGITNMMTRAENLNGSLTLHSSPGHGCTLQVNVPVELYYDED
jgi:PAS domain S-box-containing protein